jgi:hypothetical protein
MAKSVNQYTSYLRSFQASFVSLTVSSLLITALSYLQYSSGLRLYDDGSIVPLLFVIGAAVSLRGFFGYYYLVEDRVQASIRILIESLVIVGITIPATMALGVAALFDRGFIAFLLLCLPGLLAAVDFFYRSQKRQKKSSDRGTDK